MELKYEVINESAFFLSESFGDKKSKIIVSMFKDICYYFFARYNTGKYMNIVHILLYYNVSYLFGKS